MNRREFNAAALAAVLGPHLQRTAEKLRPDYDYWADFTACESWLDEMIAAAAAEVPNASPIELDGLQYVALYCAIAEWLKAQESPA